MAGIIDDKIKIWRPAEVVPVEINHKFGIALIDFVIHENLPSWLTCPLCILTQAAFMAKDVDRHVCFWSDRFIEIDD